MLLLGCRDDACVCERDVLSLPDEMNFVQIRESDSIDVVYRTPSLRTPDEKAQQNDILPFKPA